MIGQLITQGIPAAASYIGNKVGSFFNNSAPGFAVSGVPTSYGRSSPNLNVNSRGSGNPLSAQNASSMLGMSGMPAPRATLDSFANRYKHAFDYGPNETRHPGFTGYDITQMMIGHDPEFMSRIYYGQQADRLAGGGIENTLAAMQYIKERNEALYGKPQLIDNIDVFEDSL